MPTGTIQECTVDIIPSDLEDCPLAATQKSTQEEKTGKQWPFVVRLFLINQCRVGVCRRLCPPTQPQVPPPLPRTTSAISIALYV